MDELYTRLKNLENLVNALSKKIDSIKFYQDADNAGMRQTEVNQGVQIDANTTGVAENDSAICDVAELSDVNSTAIDDLAEMIDDLEQRVSALEEA